MSSGLTALREQREEPCNQLPSVQMQIKTQTYITHKRKLKHCSSLETWFNSLHWLFGHLKQSLRRNVKHFNWRFLQPHYHVLTSRLFSSLSQTLYAFLKEVKLHSSRTQLGLLLTAKRFALISVSKNCMGMNLAPLQTFLREQRSVRVP